MNEFSSFSRRGGDSCFIYTDKYRMNPNKAKMNNTVPAPIPVTALFATCNLGDIHNDRTETATSSAAKI